MVPRPEGLKVSALHLHHPARLHQDTARNMRDFFSYLCKSQTTKYQLYDLASEVVGSATGGTEQEILKVSV